MQDVRDIAEGEMAANQKVYDDQMKVMDDLEKAKQAIYDAEIKRLDAQEKTLKDAYDAASKAIDDRIEQENTAYDAASKALSAQIDSLRDGYDVAMDALGKQIDTLSDSVDGLRDISDAIHSTLDTLREAADPQRYREQAQATVAAALAAVRSGNSVADSDKLIDALGTLTQNSQDYFGSRTDYLRDAYRTRAAIENLGDLIDPQLSAAESQLEALKALKLQQETAHDASLDALERQLETLKTNHDSLIETLERSSKNLREAFDASMGRIDNQRVDLGDSLEAALEGIANSKLNAEQVLNDANKPIQTALDDAQAQYDAVMGNTAAIGSLTTAIGSLTTALAGFSLAQADAGAVAAEVGNPEVTAAQLKSIRDKVYTETMQGALDAYKEAVSLGLNADQVGAALGITAADVNQFTSTTGLSGLNDVIADADPIAEALAITQADTIRREIPPDEVIRKYVGDMMADNVLTDDEMASIMGHAIRLHVRGFDLDRILGAAPGTSSAYAVSRGYPAFASGGMYAGGMALVGEQGPELINFDQGGYIHTAPQTASIIGGSNAALIDEIVALREEVTALRAETRATAKHTSKTAALLERAMPDGDALATRIAT
jgi:hypothetical protein